MFIYYFDIKIIQTKYAYCNNIVTHRGIPQIFGTLTYVEAGAIQLSCYVALRLRDRFSVPSRGWHQIAGGERKTIEVIYNIRSRRHGFAAFS